MNLVSSHSFAHMPGFARPGAQATAAPRPAQIHSAPFQIAPESEIASKTRGTDAQAGVSGSARSAGENRDDRTQDTQREQRLAAQLRVKEAREQRLIEDQIKTLAARDREVRAHEQAHVAAGGQYAGAPVYQYERGPNGVNYAVGGEVPISTGEEATPEATLYKARIIRRAALAPAEPSAQDRRVAAMASRMEATARAEIAQAARRDEEPDDAETAKTAAEPDATSGGTPETDSTTPERTAIERQREDLARLEHRLFTRDKMLVTQGTRLSQMA